MFYHTPTGKGAMVNIPFILNWLVPIMFFPDYCWIDK